MKILPEATKLVGILSRHQRRIVVAESCTGGMVAAELAKIAGVSEWFCGSAVTYRSDTKVKWLGVKAEDIQQHTAVSHCVACQMAAGVLEKTPEANLAAAITGHLGPHAPDGFDGLVFVGTSVRGDAGISADAKRCQLESDGRLNRQTEATALVLSTLIELVETSS